MRVMKLESFFYFILLVSVYMNNSHFFNFLKRYNHLHFTLFVFTSSRYRIILVCCHLILFLWSKCP